MKTYKLIKTETGKKAQRFFYTVIDEAGNVISSRGSNREYVAATIDGCFYFGRVDLVGKGDHFKSIQFNKNVVSGVIKNFEGSNFTDAEYIEYCQNNLDRLTVAYL